MKHRISMSTLTALLLSMLLFLGGCAHAMPVGAQVSERREVEIQIDTERTAPPQLPEETDTAPLTESVMPPVTDAVTEAAAQTTATESLPEITNETTAESASNAAPAAPVRIAVPRMTTRPADEAKALLDNAGIGYTVTEQYSAQVAAGHVITVRFYGAVDEQFCHINPDYPVEVVVSLGSRSRVNFKTADPKRIYLTFDDGPHPNTDRVLEILEQYGVKATFFTIGRYISVYPDRAKAISDGGHLLACHSYSHDYLSLYQSAESVLDEIHKWEKTLTTAGISIPETVYFRFPGGTTTNYLERDRFEQIFWAVNDAGYHAMDWTCANNDRYLNNKTEDQTLTEYLLWSVEATLGSLAWTKDTPRIMLLHDVADETVEALPQILDYLIAKGYTFGTLDELDGYWVFH